MNKEDFRCKCCGVRKIDPYFYERAKQAEFFSGFRWKITSGYRCEEYDKQFGGKGNHTTGRAGDFEVKSGWHRYKMITAAIDAGFDRMGVGKEHLHLDTVADKPRPVIWEYYE